MGFEPTYVGFANRCLTTWLPHQTLVPVRGPPTCHNGRPRQGLRAQGACDRSPLLLPSLSSFDRHRNAVCELPTALLRERYASCARLGQPLANRGAHLVGR